MNQKLSWVLLIGGLATFGYQFADLLADHSTWADVARPASVAELIRAGVALLVAVGGALGVGNPPKPEKRRHGRRHGLGSVGRAAAHRHREDTDA